MISSREYMYNQCLRQNYFTKIVESFVHLEVDDNHSGSGQLIGMSNPRVIALDLDDVLCQTNQAVADCKLF